MLFNCNYYTFWNATKKPEKCKKHSVSKFVRATLRKKLSSSDFRFSQVTSVEKRKPRKHFSASASGLSLKNLFLGFLCSTAVTWEKWKSDEDKFFLRVARTNFETKHYFWPNRSSDKKLYKRPFLGLVLSYKKSFYNMGVACKLSLPRPLEWKWPNEYLSLLYFWF